MSTTRDISTTGSNNNNKKEDDKNEKYKSHAQAKTSKVLPTLAALAALGGAIYYFLKVKSNPETPNKKSAASKSGDYKAVYKSIASALEENAEGYDDGSYGPVLVRLAWHASGTYCKETKTGGSNGATMRFAPESEHGANAGLKVARDVMEKVHQLHPWISYSDLWTLGGVVAIQQMGGPRIPWRPGRSDRDSSACTPDGRLPDASKDHKHVRDIFYRMGFDDGEIVALVGAHALGRCHTDRSGYSGPWTFAPTTFSNEYFRLLLQEKWQLKKWSGPAQYEDKASASLMMLPADMALVEDKEFRKWVETYAKDEQRFFEDFAKAFSKLLELGVEFTRDSKPLVFEVVN